MKEIKDFLIVERHQMGDSYFRLVLKHDGQMPTVAPGQFVEVLVEDCPGVMLRRPISIHDVDWQASTISLIIQVVGRGTRSLAKLAAGQKLNLVYPLGHGFTLGCGKRALLVGGGAGIAPLYHLAKCLIEEGVKPTILLGGRTASLIPAREDFSQLDAMLHLATDDGSLGHHGLVVTHPAFAADYDMIYTCGPTPMMKAVAKAAAQRGIRCEASLENLMACGLGACLCCVTHTVDGHKCVCKEGPVFDTTQLSGWTTTEE